MTVVGLDASTGMAGAAVVGAGQSVSEFVAAPARPAAALLPAVLRALTRGGVAPGEVRGIAVAVGPGSYAGVRAAVATAKAWAWAADLPLAAVGSLEALAWAAAPGLGLVAAALDARRQRVYGAVYRRAAAASGLTEVLAPALLDRGRWWATVAQVAAGAAEGECVLAGPGWTAEGVAHVAAAGVRAHWVQGAERGAADAVAVLGRRLLLAGGGADPLALRPAYVSEPDLGVPRR